jgi:hypothetical protein
VPDATRYIRGYVNEIDGQRIPLEPVEVVHFRRWNPTNDYYGLSALEAGRIAVQSDRAMAEWNRNAFGQDQGVPAGIVSIKDQVSNEDFERIKREWRQSYGGTQRRTAFLRGGGIEWQNIGLSHSDLDFLQGREAQRNEILNLFGIPVGLVSENATEANAKVAERIFIERTLWPKLVRLAQKISQEMLPFWPGEHIAVFEDIRPTDAQARLEEIKTAYPLLSINELRAQYFQLPPVDWGNTPVGMGDKSNEIFDDDVRARHAVPLRNADDLDNGKAALIELRRWERFTLKRWGQAQNRAFEVQALPDEVAFEVSAGLLGAESSEEALGVFQAARAALAESEA